MTNPLNRVRGARPAIRPLDWLLIGLTLVGTLALLLFTLPATAAPVTLYRAVLVAAPGELPFGLEIATGKAVTATLINGANRVRGERVRFGGKHLEIEFPSYDAYIKADVQPDGSLAGTAHLTKRAGPADVPFRAVPGQTHRFFASVTKPAADLSGRWLVSSGSETGLALLHQAGNRITGTIQFRTGDERFLVGEVSGSQFALSTFDGNAGLVWRGTIGGAGISGDSFGPTSKAASPWRAARAPAKDASVVAVAEEAPPVAKISFAFPDVDGHKIALSDSRFRGKVVVVTIGGSWCANCHDEAQFIVPYAARRKVEGLEVIGLSFEYGGDTARAMRQIRSFAARYHITYPLLYAGEATPEATKVALPELGGVKVYPTTLFVDRKGRLRAVHVGYAGPATGALAKTEAARFDRLVSDLLREPG